ncbi:MutS-related protein [Hyunsoonleella sp. 2307UL5-6]|uniref:MutS-related protein n=1 Tax=Hyunsoonleella sp. 2307UL5-6 TaxID=3384768 RepID=UPI0039BD5079
MNMSNPQEYYNTHLEKYKLKSKKLYTQMATLSVLRLMVFLATSIGIYFCFSFWQIAVLIGVVGTVLFIYVLSKHTDTKKQKQFYDALVKINTDEITIASGDFHNRADGLELQDSKHYYSLDIDLFGKGSFFQFINRTSISEGEVELANALKANAIDNVETRQKAIQELALKPKWRQFYSANASLVAVETSANSIIKWLECYKSFLPKLIKWVPLVFTTITVLIVVLTVAEIVSQLLIGYWLFFGLILTGLYVKKINQLSVNVDKVKDTFRQYAMLLDLIENETFKTKLLQQKQHQITSDKEKASVIFKKLSKSLDALDNRNNIIGAIFGNGLFLTDIKNTYRIEQWIAQYGTKVTDWFNAVSFFDAYNSLANYTFNHPVFVFPSIAKDRKTLEVKALGHPLIDTQKRVNSDVSITGEQFFIITGANMAGKSTFLRTISLHIVMANVGLPVCATSSVYYPVKLITSMRTSDSLTDDSSYFFSELTRLKFIVDTIKNEPYFIVLDEILKGTNSTDKAIGSKKFVEKLVATNATGIIATHDLSLCDMAKELDAVKNYYFDAEIINDELYFDYKLKQGICKNMNASFLLKKMDIV